jgi:sugar phosphate isomerase/epimerase
MSAPAMIFGHDIVENAEILAGVVDNIEVVLFHTPTLNNFLSRADVRRLAQIGKRLGVSYTVHLPDSLEIASLSASRRAESVAQIVELIETTADFAPRHFVLHVPFTPPTLVPVPGLYLTSIAPHKWQDWLNRAAESLNSVLDRCRATKLLVENINYSMSFLEPLVEKGLCGICLDVGHLLLGRESVMTAMRHHCAHIKEIHLHGIEGHSDHFSLTCLPQGRLVRWMDYLDHIRFDGIVNLEVFTPDDLTASLKLLGRVSRIHSLGRLNP